MKGKLANGVGSQSDALYVELVVSTTCVTVCHHSSNGLYRTLSAQRLSERTVFLTQRSLVQSGALENISLLKRDSVSCNLFVSYSFSNEKLISVDKKNQLDVTFCIIYFSSNSCSTCFGQPCAHHQELTTA